MNKLFVLITAILTISACSPVYKTNYTYTPPQDPNAKLCASQCLNTKTYCEQACHSRQDACEAEADRDARDAYDDYVKDREKKGRELKRDESYYQRSCGGENSCMVECTTAYNNCFGTCGGNVTSSQSCTAFCDK